MPISIVVGGQFGSEGKGKVAHYLAQEMKASFAVRCGGPNSGHTVIDENGNARIFQQLPTAAILPKVNLAICAGSYIDLDILFKEMKETGLEAGRLFIDPEAVIITDELKRREAESGLVKRIGSTGSGTGTAVSARINREDSLLFAKDIEKLKPFIADLPKVLRNALSQQERLIIEGTQGVGLSPFHSRHYPYTTSRDTTAAAFLAETGLSPFDVDDVILTIRAFPIRVGGNSGPLKNEIDWHTVTIESGHHKPIEERTSVTKNIRRVARFDSKIVELGIAVNSPKTIILNHIDYISKKDRDNFVEYVENSIKRPIDYIGLGQDIIVKRNKLTLVKTGQTNNLRQAC